MVAIINDNRCVNQGGRKLTYWLFNPSNTFYFLFSFLPIFLFLKVHVHLQSLTVSALWWHLRGSDVLSASTLNNLLPRQIHYTAKRCLRWNDCYCRKVLHQNNFDVVRQLALKIQFSTPCLNSSKMTLMCSNKSVNPHMNFCIRMSDKRTLCCHSAWNRGKWRHNSQLNCCRKLSWCGGYKKPRQKSQKAVVLTSPPG